MSRPAPTSHFLRGLIVALVLVAPLSAADDALDRLEETLTFATRDAQFRARVLVAWHAGS